MIYYTVLGSYQLCQNSAPLVSLQLLKRVHERGESQRFRSMMLELSHFLQYQYLKKYTIFLINGYFSKIYNLGLSKKENEKSPKEKSASPAPTATADPLEDPPGTLSAAHGFLGVP